MKLEILKPQDKILRRSCVAVTPFELRTKKIQNLIEDMLGIVYGKNNKGTGRDRNKPMTVGLSASQVGVNKRISIVDLAIARKGYSDIHILINPEIVWRSKSLIDRREGCVNLPTIWGYIKRAKRVKVRALDRSGNKIQIEAGGWPAVLLQHEIDHLDGKLFIDRLEDPTKAHLVLPEEYTAHKRAGKKWNKFIDVSNLAKVRPRNSS